MFSRAIFVRVMLLCFGIMLASGIARSQAAFSATTLRAVTVYGGAGLDAPVLGQLDAGAAVSVAGRDDPTLWGLIQNGDMEGWIEASSIALDNNEILRDLPVITDMPPEPEAAALSTDPNVLAIIARLKTTPILYNLTTDSVRAIYAHGQELGNNPGIFTKIGDSNTTNGDFLRPMGLGYCQLGAYSYLQETIDYFRSYRFLDGSNSFTRYSKAAYEGFSSSAALDSMWSYRPCHLNETPVGCEYRLTKASAVIIMLGLMDVRYSSEEFYKENMRQVITSLMDNGVIPVLTTIIVLPDQKQLSFDTSIVINGALLDLAEEYHIPFLNLWRAVQTLPGYGIGPDRTHLKQVSGKFCVFDGSEQEIGGTLRNLLSLEVLDVLRREVYEDGDIGG